MAWFQMGFAGSLLDSFHAVHSTEMEGIMASITSSWSPLSFHSQNQYSSGVKMACQNLNRKANLKLLPFRSWPVRSILHVAWFVFKYMKNVILTPDGNM